ncbi:MAG: hypothetical protein PHE27_05240 [Alphaproteobacteria bacterium]|nr:hypothetical protein [Alphaproteobacteria bacterium]
MTLGHALQSMIARNRIKIRNINRRYAHPRIALTPTVRWALVALRFYLLFLVALLGYKFFTMLA